MRPRTVIVTLELETDAPLRDIKKGFEVVKQDGIPTHTVIIKQISCNVIKPTKKGEK